MRIRKVPFVGLTGWAVNSIAIAVEGSSPSLPNIYGDVLSYLEMSALYIFFSFCYNYIYTYCRIATH